MPGGDKKWPRPWSGQRPGQAVKLHTLRKDNGRVLIVGDNTPALEIESLLKTRGWFCERIPGTNGVLRRLRDQADLDLVLLVPDAETAPFLELCRHIKFDLRTAYLSVIVVQLAGRPRDQAALLAAGADDALSWPAGPEKIMLRLGNACRIKRATDYLEDANAVISSLANAIEGRDSYTRGHVERVSAYAVELGRRAGVSADELVVLRTGGIVHDIGKVAVPDQILNKPDRLLPAERELVERHPAVGYDILQPLRTFRDVLPVVRWHHERPNGTGYPDGLCGDAIPLVARIVAVADVFDALSTARAYRPAYTPEEYRSILLEAGQRGDLDAELVRILLESLTQSLSLWSSPTSRGAVVATS